MPSHHAWVPIRVAAHDGESAEQYQRRRAEIERIVTGFRMGRFADAEAERMERRLMQLRRQAAEGKITPASR
jgi:hypothetical protein